MATLLLFIISSIIIINFKQILHFVLTAVYFGKKSNVVAENQKKMRSAELLIFCTLFFFHNLAFTQILC